MLVKNILFLKIIKLFYCAKKVKKTNMPKLI